MNSQYADEELIKQLPGFQSKHANVNGTHIHYVEGGAGMPLLLIPGWPETWWAYHKVMPLLAAGYRVIVVDLRGMGSSAMPQEGYEKKNMARDLYALVQEQGWGKVFIAGHDIGAHVAFSFAAQFPEVTAKLVMLDTPHPDGSMYQLPMLPIPGADYTYPWWLAFNQVKGLPEQLLQGRMHLLIDWVFQQLLVNKDAVSRFDRQVYAFAYDTVAGISASNAWYQAFAQDIKDRQDYGMLSMPVYGIAANGYDMLQQALSDSVSDLHMAKIENSGHFLMEEQPEQLASLMATFLG